MASVPDFGVKCGITISVKGMSMKNVEFEGSAVQLDDRPRFEGSRPRADRWKLANLIADGGATRKASSKLPVPVARHLSVTRQQFPRNVRFVVEPPTADPATVRMRPEDGRQHGEQDHRHDL